MVRIPSEYQEVEYLESTGTQYVQTSYTPQNTDEITCDFSIIGSIVGLSNAQALFSAGTGATQLILLLCHYDGANSVNGAYYKYFASGGAKQFNFYPSYNSKYRLTISSNGTVFCNGYSVQSKYEGVVNTGLHLMRRANNASPFFGRLYNFVLSNSGIKKLDLIPCYRKSDNEPGMYDTVSKQFFTNAGTGTFLVGNDVSWEAIDLLALRRRMMLMQGEGGGDDLILERGQYAVYENYYVDGTTGDLVPYNGWTSTDYIDVSQGYLLSEQLSPNYTAFYDEQKNRISRAATKADDATNANIVFIMPKAEAKFMRISYASSQHPVVYTLKAGAIVIK